MADCVVCSKPLVDTAYVCAIDDRDLARRLDSAAALWPELAVTVARRDRMAAPGPRSRGHAPAHPVRPDGGQLRHYADQQTGWAGGLPVNLAAADVADAVTSTARVWARVVAAERHGDQQPYGPICLECDHPTCERIHAWRRQMPPPARLSDLLRWLAGQLGWLRYHPAAGEAWDELGYAARLVERAVDRPEQRRYLGPCQEPDGLAGICPADLYAHPRATTVRCRTCGTRHVVADRRHWLDGLVMDRAYTAAEIAAAYPDVRADRIRQWASRGRLVNHGQDRHRRPLYRLGEVLALASRTPTQRRERIAA